MSKIIKNKAQKLLLKYNKKIYKTGLEYFWFSNKLLSNEISNNNFKNYFLKLF